MSKRKPYIPKPRHNPEQQARQLEKIKDNLEKQDRILQTVTKSYDRHMEHLANFAKHDIGNAIQSMYAVLKLISTESPDDNYLALKTSVDNMQAALDNFQNLVPYSKTGSFQLSKLITGLEVMARSSCSLENIYFEVDSVRDLEVHQPYQALLQLLHNLVINSIKSLKYTSKDKILRIETTNTKTDCIIKVKDTGCGIKDEHVDSVFTYGFTTTDGSGIGLYHAKYVCDNIKGSIFLERNTDCFSTVFTLKFPINGNKENISH